MQNCECGGLFKDTVQTEFDFSSFAGMPVKLTDAPAIQCSKCGRQTLRGTTINFVMDLLFPMVTSAPKLLTADQARFLRKRMRLTQQALAGKMGIARETVAKWECGDSDSRISQGHDLMLRAISSAHAAYIGQGLPKADIFNALKEVHEAPLSVPPPFVIEKILAKMRSGEPLMR